MMTKVPLSELTDRMKRFGARMDAESPNWELAAFFGRVNQYYFTGTMQDGVLLVSRGGETVFCVRRSFERACAESGGAGSHPHRNRAGAARVGPAFPKTFPLQRSGLAGHADRPGAGGEESV